MVRKVLHGVGADRALLTEPFAALLVRVLKIAQAIYTAFRHAGERRTKPRVWRGPGSSLVAASDRPSREDGRRGARRVPAQPGAGRLRETAAGGSTAAPKKAARASTRLRCSRGSPRVREGSLWPWVDEEGRLLPHAEDELEPEMAAACFFVLLTHVANERRTQNLSGGLSKPFAERDSRGGRVAARSHRDDLADPPARGSCKRHRKRLQGRAAAAVQGGALRRARRRGRVGRAARARSRAARCARCCCARASGRRSSCAGWKKRAASSWCGHDQPDRSAQTAISSAEALHLAGALEESARQAPTRPAAGGRTTSPGRRRLAGTSARPGRGRARCCTGSRCAGSISSRRCCSACDVGDRHARSPRNLLRRPMREPQTAPRIRKSRRSARLGELETLLSDPGLRARLLLRRGARRSAAGARGGARGPRGGSREGDSACSTPASPSARRRCSPPTFAVSLVLRVRAAAGRVCQPPSATRRCASPLPTQQIWWTALRRASPRAAAATMEAIAESAAVFAATFALSRPPGLDGGGRARARIVAATPPAAAGSVAPTTAARHSALPAELAELAPAARQFSSGSGFTGCSSCSSRGFFTSPSTGGRPLLPLDIPATRTRILSVTAGASCAAGGPGPRHRTAAGLRSTELPVRGWACSTSRDSAAPSGTDRAVAAPAWLPCSCWCATCCSRARSSTRCSSSSPPPLSPCCPTGGETRCAADPPALRALRTGSRPSRPPDMSTRASSRLQIPLTAAGSDLWAIREVSIRRWRSARSPSSSTRRRGRGFARSSTPSQTRLFDAQLPAAEAALLDDLVGARDEEGSLSLDAGSLAALYPQAHPLAIYGAVERAANAQRPLANRTQFSAKTIEARLTGRSFPQAPQPYDAEFERRASRARADAARAAPAPSSTPPRLCSRNDRWRGPTTGSPRRPGALALWGERCRSCC